MTNELAIRILTGDVLCTASQEQEAIMMAVKALSQSKPRWIPCSEGMPKEKEDVLITFERNMAVGYLERDAWYINIGNNWVSGIDIALDGLPLAWQPTPEPYKGES